MATNNSINNTVEENDFSVNRSTAGTAVESSVEHSDNSNTGSHARLLAQSGGGSGGDAFLLLNIPSGQDYSFGVDNSDSDILKIQDDADPSTGNNLWSMTSSGERNMPLQPYFCAYNSVQDNDVTGDATNYTVIFDTELVDANSDYNTGTGTFTCSVDGNYDFGAKVYTLDNAAAHTAAFTGVITSDNSFNMYDCPAKIFVAADGGVDYLINVTAPMDAADTAFIRVKVTGGTKIIDIAASVDDAYFYGALAY